MSFSFLILMKSSEIWLTKFTYQQIRIFRPFLEKMLKKLIRRKVFAQSTAAWFRVKYSVCDRDTQTQFHSARFRCHTKPSHGDLQQRHFCEEVSRIGLKIHPYLLKSVSASENKSVIGMNKRFHISKNSKMKNSPLKYFRENLKWNVIIFFSWFLFKSSHIY